MKQKSLCIALTVKILLKKDLSLDAINIILDKAFPEINQICQDCGRIDLCVACGGCRPCNRSFSSRDLCQLCIDKGWYT